jgi:hypothetical protein
MTTVRELIEHLATYDPDTRVLVSGEYDIYELENGFEPTEVIMEGGNVLLKWQVDADDPRPRTKAIIIS